MFAIEYNLSMKLGATVRSQLMANKMVMTRTVATTKDKSKSKSSPAALFVLQFMSVRTTMVAPNSLPKRLDRYLQRGDHNDSHLNRYRVHGLHPGSA